MTSFQSPIESIASLRIHPLKSCSVYKADKVVRIGSAGGFIFVRKGTVYHSGFLSEVHYWIGHQQQFIPLFRALARLRILSKDDVDDHIDRVKLAVNRQDIEYEIKTMKKYARKYNFTVTKT